MNQTSPPRLPLKLARWILPPGRKSDALLGDMEELYQDRLHLHGRLRTNLWFLGASIFSGLRYRVGALSVRVGLLQASRRLSRRPGYLLSTVITLAIGFAIAVGTFAVVSGVLLAPLPYPDADRLVQIEFELPGFPYENGGHPIFGGPWAHYLTYAELSQELESVGAYNVFRGPFIDGDAQPTTVPELWTTPSLQTTLGIVPTRGRLLDRSDPIPGDEVDGAMLFLDDFAVSRSVDGEAVLGRQVHLQGSPFRVVGTLPAGTEVPIGGEGVRVWTSATNAQIEQFLTGFPQVVIGRMNPRATVESVQRELDELIEETKDRYPFLHPTLNMIENGAMRARVRPLKDALTQDVRRSIWLVFGSTLVLLTIAIVNVTNLTLVRADVTRHLTATRIALGASSGEIARHFLAEAGVIVGAAWLVGMTIAASTLELIRGLPLEGIPRIGTSQLTATTWGLSGMVALALVALLGYAPILRKTSISVLTSGGKGQTSSRAQFRLRNALIGVQVGMACVLLIASALLSQSFFATHRVNPGFESADIMTFRLLFPFNETRNTEGGDRAPTRFFTELRDRIARVPGVADAGISSCLPLDVGCDLSGTTMRPMDGMLDGSDDIPVIGFRQVSDGYLETIGIPVIAGRPLERRDIEQISNGVLVNETLANLFWPDSNPIGKLIDRNSLASRTVAPLEVIGVVGDVHTDGLTSPAPPMLYQSLVVSEQASDLSSVVFVVQTEGPLPSLVDQIGAEVAALRSDVPVTDIRTLESVVDNSTARARFSLWLLAISTAVALLLSTVGIYSVISYVVRRRRSEFGIRLALGAHGGSLKSLVLRDGAIPVLVGLIVGLAVALLGSGVLSAFLFGVAPTDPFTYGMVAIILIAVSTAAAYLPAAQASRVPPTDALRSN